MTSLDRPVALALHGGAGSLRAHGIDPTERQAIAADLRLALAAGARILQRRGSALDAVVAVVVFLEDSPWFNAGRGAVFTADGRHELDAAVMDGPSLRAGAVAGLQSVKNPVLLARRVMERSAHVLLACDGAERFADHQPDIERVPQSYFSTEARRQQLADAQAHEAMHGAGAYFGTVGAVALDALGQLAAATSTGGLSNKRFGRIGDSPLIGAGTYADSMVAVSATGTGEVFIRAAVAHELCARVRHGKESLAVAAADLIGRVVPDLGGEGGLIALDARGQITLPFTTSSMHRGWLHPDGSRGVAIFGEPEWLEREAT